MFTRHFLRILVLFTGIIVVCLIGIFLVSYFGYKHTAVVDDAGASGNIDYTAMQ
jgi:hypothetical protein